MKNILILFISLLISNTILAQLNIFGKWNYDNWNSQKDTLVIDFGNGLKSELAFKWQYAYAEKELLFKRMFWDDFSTQLTFIKEEIPKLVQDENHKYHVKLKVNQLHIMTKFFQERMQKDSVLSPLDSLRYSHFAEHHSTLTVDKRQAVDQMDEFIVVENKLIGKAKWQHIIEIDHVFWKLKIHLNDINDLDMVLSPDYYSFFREGRKKYIEDKRYKSINKMNYNYSNGQLLYKHQWRDRLKQRNKRMTLQFQPMAGTSILKSKFSADMGLMLAACWHKNNPNYPKIGIRYQIKGIGEETLNGSQINYNGFVDAVFDMGIGKTDKRQDWIGAGVGYLVHQAGKTYGDNTARIFLKYQSSKYWGIQPEYNYSFADNKGFIGLGFFFSL